MPHTARAALALAILLTAATGRAEEPTRRAEPPDGLLWLVGGGVATGLGVINLAGSGLCFATLPQAQRVPCAATSVAFGLASVGLGVPLLVVGAEKRAEWRVWMDHVVLTPRRD